MDLWYFMLDGNIGTWYFSVSTPLMEILRTPMPHSLHRIIYHKGTYWINNKSNKKETLLIILYQSECIISKLCVAHHLKTYCMFTNTVCYNYFFSNATGDTDFILTPDRGQGNKNQTMNIKLYRHKTLKHLTDNTANSLCLC